MVNVASAPFLYYEYGSIGGSPTGLQDQLWFGVKNATDEQASAPAAFPAPRPPPVLLAARLCPRLASCCLGRCWC